jgi:phosphoribosylanthranilate isomerase
MKVKICGLTTYEAVYASIDAGADYLGFVSCPGSVRHLMREKCAHLMAAAKDLSPETPRVVVVVNPTDQAIDEIIKTCVPTHIQLHGDETPERLDQINDRFAVKIIKAVGISELADLDHITSYEMLSDTLLLDAKPPKALAQSGVTGGHGLGFDWSLLKEFAYQKSWFLAGGLDEFNLKTAKEITHAPMVDVSSSLEKSPGVKDIDKISRFLEIAKSL